MLFRSDNIYLRQGRFATNAQLVRRAALILNTMGIELATPAEARVILGLTPRQSSGSGA